MLRRCVWSRNIKNRRSIYIYDISSLRINGCNRSNCEQFYITFFYIVPLQHNAFVRHHYPSDFSNHGIFPIDVVLCARCWWPTRTTFISNMCSTRFKPFHPLTNLSLTHGTLSILSQHTTVNCHRFHFFCPNKPHYATLFFDGAILQRSVNVFALVAAIRMKAERCTANGWNLQQALSIMRNAPAPLCPGYCVI